MRTGLDTGRVAMGDFSAEPSMEEILSSIKRIIAEEGDVTQTRPRRPTRTPISATPDLEPRIEPGGREEILELSDPMPPAKPRPVENETPRASHDADSIVSQQTAAASRGALETLSKLLVKPEPGNEGTLEGLVREMLRPMLSEWLDANLPDLVETLVAREIEKIVGQSR